MNLSSAFLLLIHIRVYQFVLYFQSTISFNFWTVFCLFVILHFIMASFSFLHFIFLSAILCDLILVPQNPLGVSLSHYLCSDFLFYTHWAINVPLKVAFQRLKWVLLDQPKATSITRPPGSPPINNSLCLRGYPPYPRISYLPITSYQSLNSDRGTLLNQRSYPLPEVHPPH